MPYIRWMEACPSEGAPLLKEALRRWGYDCREGSGEGTLILVAQRPDPSLIPLQGTDILWWVQEGTMEEASVVLGRRPGWVMRQDRPLEEVWDAILYLQHRDLGSEGWLRQMLHLASLDELLRFVLVRVIQLAGATQGAIWIRHDDAFYQRIGEGFPEAPISSEEAETLIQQGEGWMLCPQERMGILRLKNPKDDPESYLGWMKEVEYVLINAWNLERSQALSFKDDLTVAHNRRCLEVELPQAIRDAAAHGESVALLFLDVDNLKALNSRFGHPTGSLVLTTVASEAHQIIRTQDKLYRYGGDEFCILMPSASSFGAAKLGERLIQTLTNKPLEIRGQEVPVSISVGIATFPAHADGAERLVERADRALFQAKAAGKGRVVVAT